MTAAPLRPLLVELLVEELPPKALRSLAAAFAEGIASGLRAESLLAEGVTATYATPRRLAVLIEAVASQAADRAVSHKLMPVSVGLTATGEASPALLKKLAAVGAGPDAVPRLARRPDGKSETLFLDASVAGSSLADGLQRALDRALASLRIDKWMQYQLADGWTSVSFVRPAHGLVALHGDAVVPVRALGLEAGRTTLGHRFEAREAPITLRSATTYAAQLRDEGAVIASFDERRAETLRQLQAAAAAAGAAAIDDEALLVEVTALVERPNVLVCEFEPEFLEVPPECLILTMRANQKYFPLFNSSGELTNRFLIVSNISPADPSRIVEGNERVVRPRLADAKFFYDQDRKVRLESRLPGLDRVVYHGKLGSQGDRVRRVRAIARWVAEQVGSDVGAADRAAELAKADLLTDMVGEFPELQGLMGAYYALHDGEGDAVAAAIRDQYLSKRPQLAGDASLVGEALLLADRAEALVGLWGIGAKPTGDRDPYALRRAALAIISSFEQVGARKRFAKMPLALTLRELLETAAATFTVALAPATVAEVEAFVYERYFQQLSTAFDSRAVDAVVSLKPPLHEVVGRVRAVREFIGLTEAATLAAANKRVGNILKKSDTSPAALDPSLLSEPAERALAAALAEVGERADAAYRSGEYARSLSLLAGLRPAVDAFFETVLVNAEAPAVRANRLALLAMLRATMNRVADLARLAT